MSQPACTIIVDRQTLNPTDGVENHVALADVNVHWGRQSRIDQPGTSTCTFTVLLDPNGNNTILQQLQPGATVEVNAISEQAPTETRRLVWSYPARIKTTTEGFNPLNQWWHPKAQSDDPAAWDDIPRATYGTTAEVRLHIAYPPNTVVKLIPLWFKTPSSEPVEDTTTFVLQNGTNTITFPLNPLYAGQWLSVRIHAESVGPAWHNMGHRTWADVPVTFESLGSVYLSNVSLAIAKNTYREVNIFTGNIVSAPISWNDEAQRPQIAITASDFTTQLANIRIGDKAWPKETARARLNRISELVGHLRIYMPANMGQTLLAAKDIDNTSALSLLEEIALSLGALLWSTSHDAVGAYLRFENPDERTPLYVLKYSGGKLSIVGRPNDTQPVDANQLLLEGATWEYDASDLATTVIIRYVDDEGTERRYTLEDTARRTRYGYRAHSVGTLLTSEADAAALATRLLNRYAPGGWILPEATMLSNGLDNAEQHAFLDATERLGKPVTLNGLSPWIPGAPSTPAYLDGGTIHYNGKEWTHTLSLTRGAAPSDSIRFNQLPPATYAQTPLTWLDFSTVGTI